MSGKNKYLIQALRAYRHVYVGQFDQETRTVVQETQDAAAALEEADRRIAELEAGVTIKFDADATPGVGLVSGRSWEYVKAMLEKDDGGSYVATAIVADKRGLYITWKRNVGEVK